MSFDEVAQFVVQPAVGPPGPRVLAVLALAVVAGVVWTFRAVADGWILLTHSRAREVRVEVPSRRLRSHHP
jgi:hypothetical protein